MELVKQMNEVNSELLHAQMEVNSLTEKVMHLETICEDAKLREQHSRELVMELLERQKELNVMLNRASMMLNRAQEVILSLSAEFTELAEAQPAHKKKEWNEKLSRINELFRQTGVPDAEFGLTEEQPALEEGIAPSPEVPEPVEGRFAEIPDVEKPAEETVEETPEPTEAVAASMSSAQNLLFSPRKKSWRR